MAWPRPRLVSYVYLRSAPVLSSDRSPSHSDDRRSARQGDRGHYELVLHCDLIVAATDATFLAVETFTAMAPLAGGVQRLAERLCRNRAAELVMLAEPLSRKAAGEIGLVCRVVEDSEVEATAAELAARLTAGPTLAYGATRALLKAWSSGGVAGADDLLLDVTMRLFETDDAQRAFLALKNAIVAGDDKSENGAWAKIDFSGS